MTKYRLVIENPFWMGIDSSLFLGIGENKKGINSIIAKGHISDRNEPNDLACAAFSSAIQMFIIALEGIRQEKYSVLQQESGLMVAIFEKNSFWQKLLKNNNLNPSKNLEEIARLNNWEEIDSIEKFKKRLINYNSVLDGKQKGLFFKKKLRKKPENAIIDAFFWVLNGLKKEKKSQLSIFHFMEDL